MFRDRVMFPIIDLRGSVIGFGGRVLEGDGPKYLNSPDTLVFKKTRNLFAMNIAKNTKEGSLILAEGYMDVISIHQAGFDNAVASLGTSLTAEQARLISQYVNQVIIAYDADGAGQKATRRAISLFEETGVKIRVLSIPDAKDPDEYIKKFGPARFKLLLEGSAGAVDFEIAKLRQKFDLETADGKVAFLKEFCSLMAGINSPVGGMSISSAPPRSSRSPRRRWPTRWQLCAGGGLGRQRKKPGGTSAPTANQPPASPGIWSGAGTSATLWRRTS